jgi:hypothetical protein
VLPVGMGFRGVARAMGSFPVNDLAIFPAWAVCELAAAPYLPPPQAPQQKRRA